MSKKTLEELREDLKIARSNDLDFRERFDEKSKELLAQIDELKNQFNEANSELIDDWANASKQVLIADEELRNAIIVHYQTTGIKTIDKTMSVRVNTAFVYNPKDAFDWAMKHKLCLTLDKKAFEKLLSVQDLEFVEKEEKVIAVIATNL